MLNVWYKVCDFVEFKMWPHKLEILVLIQAILSLILIFGWFYSLGVDCS